MNLVIPTRLREKLPEDFAYPLWPSKITEYLEHTPQRNDAELVFRWRDEFWESHWRQRILQKGTVTLVAAKYTTQWSPYFPKWKIEVYSVPREYLTAAQEILFGGALEDLARRLTAHGAVPDHDVKEKVVMNRSEWDHDETRLTAEQLASEPEKVA